MCIYVCLFVEENTVATIPSFRQNKINILTIVINPEILGQTMAQIPSLLCDSIVYSQEWILGVS